MKWLDRVDCFAEVEVKDDVLKLFRKPCYKCVVSNEMATK